MDYLMFITLKDGRRINIFHIAGIQRTNNQIIFKSARGTMSDIIENYNTVEEAITRYNELNDMLVVPADQEI